LKLKGTGRLFADDAAFVYREENFEDLKIAMQSDLSAIASYLASINLELSTKKN
jgi:hypothetical protein